MAEILHCKSTIVDMSRTDTKYMYCVWCLYVSVCAMYVSVCSMHVYSIVCMYASIDACMYISITPFYSTLLRTSRSASRLASESFFDSTPRRPQKTLLRPCREDGAPRGVLDLGVTWVAAAFIGFGEAYLVWKDVNRSFLVVETHPNSPFFLAVFGPSRATVVYRFWKGDCNMRIWESHHVFILTTFGTMNYPIIWQHEDLGESSTFIILELYVVSFPKFQLENATCVHCGFTIERLGYLQSWPKNKSSGSRMHLKVEKT